MMTVPFLINALMNFAIGLLVARFLGPDEYGQYALAVSLGILMQTMGLDWLRLCATRHCSDEIRLVRPEIRVALNALLAAIVGVGVLAAVAIVMAGIHAALSSVLPALAIAVAVANGLFEFVAAILAHVHGFAQAGQLALAFDLGIRIVGAIGATLDVLLFQVAARADATQGAVAACRQITRNMGIVFAVMVSAVAGCWLVLPSFTQLVIPESFHGSFERYFTSVLPAMLRFALTHYCVGPAFQITHRTVPLTVGGLAAAATNGAAIVLLPRTDDATSFAVAQSLGAFAALVVLVGFLRRLEPMWPRARDVVGTLTATSAMIVSVLPMRDRRPCIVTLAGQAVIGASVYVVVAFAFDIAGSREMLWGRLESWRRQDASATAPAGSAS